MPLWSEYAFYGALIGAALMAAAAFSDITGRSMRRRAAMRRLDDAAVRERGKDALHRVERSTAMKKDGRLGALLNWAIELHVQAGGKPAPAMLGLLTLAALVGSFTLIHGAVANTFAAGLLAAGVAALTPYFLLLRQRGKRRARFTAQLPEAIDVIVRSLRAGHPLTTAISMVGRDLPEPIGDEFAACAQEMTYGLDLQSAVRGIADRVGASEASVLASAVAIQQRSGGNLGEILHRLAKLLRDRAKLQAKAKALSSEGRYSGLFLSAMPFIMFGMVSLFNPDYYGQVRDNPLIAPVLIATFVWMLLGSFVINRMVNFKP